MSTGNYESNRAAAAWLFNISPPALLLRSLFQSHRKPNQQNNKNKNAETAQRNTEREIATREG